jgi:hypothetical protein
MIERKRETNPSGADLSRSLVNAMVAKILPFCRNLERNSGAIGNQYKQALLNPISREQRGKRS